MFSRLSGLASSIFSLLNVSLLDDLAASGSFLQGTVIIFYLKFLPVQSKITDKPFLGNNYSLDFICDIFYRTVFKQSDGENA